MNAVIGYLKSHSSVDHPICGKDLSNHFDIPGAKIRAHINAARQNGIPICSTRWGYYYSESRDDIEKTVQSLRRRIMSQESAIRGLSSLL